MKVAIQLETIEQKIFIIRGQKVMLSPHLAMLYEVEPRSLIQAVKRNLDRFPTDFCFQLNNVEFKILKSQFVISSWGGIRSNPYAFTEQGIAMLSSVLHSQKAVQINIAIMRAFVKLRQALATHKDLAERLNKLEGRMDRKDKEVIALFETIRKLMEPPPQKPRGPVGFHI